MGNFTFNKEMQNMTLVFKKAIRKARKARIAIAGPSGSGKTMTALRLAKGMLTDGRILLLDTEKGSSTLYDTIDFDQADLPDFNYDTYLAALKQAGEAGYEVVIVDSLSHAWEEFLDQHNKMQGNSFTNWGKITPKYNQLIQAIVQFPGHIICTMRAKSEYVLSDKGNGKQVPERVGMGVIMRPGSEYEFDVVGMLDISHNMTIEKTRLQWLADKIVTKPDEKLGKEIREWLDSGAVTEHWYQVVGLPDDKRPAAEKYLTDNGAEYMKVLGVWKSAKELPKLKAYEIGSPTLPAKEAA